MMVTTSFLSMWLSNTASTAMMLPIANAILKSLFGHREAQKDLHREGDESAGELGGCQGHTTAEGMSKVHRPLREATGTHTCWHILWAKCFDSDS